jgi:hypothetical protein
MKQTYQQQLQSLKNIKVRSDIRSLEILNIFEDDHCQCAEARINGIPLEFMWYDSIGFLEYWDESDRAFKLLLECIPHAVDTTLENQE